MKDVFYKKLKEYDVIKEIEIENKVDKIIKILNKNENEILENAEIKKYFSPKTNTIVRKYMNTGLSRLESMKIGIGLHIITLIMCK